jgi:succinate dehydrogenase/fumarate reductase flavoprotein subunit
MGGIVTDQCGETPLKGLFAVGEVAAGVHGAKRLGGNALAEIFTMGCWVGEMAAERSTEFETTPAPNNAIEEERSRLEKAYADKALSIKQLMNELKVLMWENVGVIREKSGLVQALEYLRETLPRVAVSSPTDLIKLLELQNMRCVAKMVCRAALERTESRGSHFRSDYPAEDNRIWLKNIVLRKSATGIKLETKPVSLDLVKLAV